MRKKTRRGFEDGNETKEAVRVLSFKGKPI
jgi:hypothetical protein